MSDSWNVESHDVPRETTDGDTQDGAPSGAPLPTAAGPRDPSPLTISRGVPPCPHAPRSPVS